MNLNFSGPSLSFFALLAIIWGILVTVFWLVVAWRAMRAHEQIADALAELARQSRPNPLDRH